MPIEFHCDHCGRKVKTGGENAGKRGRCPHCQQSVYIPTPSEELEPLELAPLDEREEAEKQRLMDETLNLTRKLREDRTEVPPEHARPRHESEPLGDARFSSDMKDLIVQFVVAMAAGRLDEAEQLREELRASRQLALEALDELSMDQVPPAEFEGIPRPVVNGILKQLRESE